MEQEIIEIKQAEVLQAIDRAEVDIQISTAKQYPRDLQVVLNKIATYATMDKETAEDCFYVLRRKNDRGQDTIIDGLSVRMAEIIASAWGNIRVATRIIGNDGKTITAQAVCHDLESNVAITKCVPRRITNKGRQDIQRGYAGGDRERSSQHRLPQRGSFGDTQGSHQEDHQRGEARSPRTEHRPRKQPPERNRLLRQAGPSSRSSSSHTLGVKTVEAIDKQMIFELRALRNAIEEGTTTVKETFIDQEKEAQAQAEAVKKATTAKDKAVAAMAAATGEAPVKPAAEAEEVDTETGEVKPTNKQQRLKANNTINGHETWTKVPGHDNHFISDQGRVRSIDHIVSDKGRPSHRKGRIFHLTSRRKRVCKSFHRGKML